MDSTVLGRKIDIHVKMNQVQKIWQPTKARIKHFCWWQILTDWPDKTVSKSYMYNNEHQYTLPLCPVALLGMKICSVHNRTVDLLPLVKFIDSSFHSIEVIVVDQNTMINQKK